jgi:4-alpha-glucanotransferase
LSLRYKRGKVIDVETGENRFTVPNPLKDVFRLFRIIILVQGYQMYHDAGVAVPVFSLRTEDGFGVGEFSDIKKLADWAKNQSRNYPDSADQ